MEIVLKRIAKKADYTIGKVYINGKYFCDSIEDKDRGLVQDMSEEEIAKKKVYGETAIPAGEYGIELRVSPRLKDRYYGKPYGGKFPSIAKVPGFSGILIHPLNTAKDSLGCIGLGENREKGKVVNSAATYYKFMDKYLLPALECGEKVIISIS